LMTAPQQHRRQQTVAEVRDLTKSFGGRQVLDRLNLRIDPGEFVALLGRSGSGKSTLLRILAGLDKAVGGDVRTTESVSIAFQEPRLLPWRSVWRNVALGLGKKPGRLAAQLALREVGLDGHAQAWPLTLSGGEAQRVSLARALVRSPSLLLLDEPFGALDALTRLSMHQLLDGLWKAHRPAVLLVTHDVDEALRLADRVVVLGHGRIVAEHHVDAPRPRGATISESLRAAVLADIGVHTYQSTIHKGQSRASHA
jgi:sulfonate transport system ATP-binding protein